VGSGDAQYQPMYLTDEAFGVVENSSRFLTKISPELSDNGGLSFNFLPGPVKLSNNVKAAFYCDPRSHRSTEFINAHQKWAADVDQDGDVDFDDLKRLLEFLTGEIDNFGVASEWLFVDAQQLETATAEELYDNPKTIIELLIANDNIDDMDFTGIRLGDIVVDQVGGLVSEDDIDALGAIVAEDPTDSNFEIKVRELVTSIDIDDVKVYPNPFSGSFQMSYLCETNTDITIELTDVRGRVLYSKSHATTKGQNNTAVTLDTPHNGILIYRIINGDKVKSGKILSL
jgi:hypothetical protein